LPLNDRLNDHWVGKELKRHCFTPHTSCQWSFAVECRAPTRHKKCVG
jgi:hypothetical protein